MSLAKIIERLFSTNEKEEQNKQSTLSSRGYRATQTPLRSDMDLFFDAKENLWDTTTNPDGKFPLNVAENNLCWEELQQMIEQKLHEHTIPKWVSGYTGMGGHDSFLEAYTSFLSRHLAHQSLSTDRIAVSAGATAVMEVASWVLCDKGGVAVIPAPCYPVYTQDIGIKSRVERYNLTTHHHLDELKNGSIISIEHLKRAKNDIESQGKTFELLLLTHPDNPTGVIYTEDQLRELARWCTHNEIHILVNELYGLSLIDITHPDIAADYNDPPDFFSFIRIMEEEQSPYLHQAYGLSKDFGVSGFRIGSVYSHNDAFLEAYRNVNAPHMVSNMAQWIFEMIFKDEAFVDQYISLNQARLTDSYATVIKSLRTHSVPYVPARGSLFVWLDLSELMKDNSDESENRLWVSIYKESGILLTPGEGFGHSKRGLFRLVHSFMNTEAITVAVERLMVFVENARMAGKVY